jgi:hypothetical protein
MRLEDFDMDTGTEVEVDVYGGAFVRRVVYQAIDNKIVVCSRKELEIAVSEGRSVVGVGYDIEKVFPVNE